MVEIQATRLLLLQKGYWTVVTESPAGDTFNAAKVVDGGKHHIRMIFDAGGRGLSVLSIVTLFGPGRMKRSELLQRENFALGLLGMGRLRQWAASLVLAWHVGAKEREFVVLGSKLRCYNPSTRFRMTVLETT